MLFRSWPGKSVRIINPAAADSIPDIMARQAAQHFTTVFGRSFVVDNRAGANGIIGMEVVAQSPPDGYTLLAASSGILATNTAVMPRLPFQVMRDFAPFSLVFSAAFGLFVHPSLPAKNVKELVALAKAKPVQLPYGSFGPASFPHMAMQLFQLQTGARLTERFYRVEHGRSRETRDTGLGLAIVKHVLLRHQATLEIQSEPGKGSTFRVEFPVWWYMG